MDRWIDGYMDIDTIYYLVTVVMIILLLTDVKCFAFCEINEN